MNPLSVSCPKCKAAPGQPCMTGGYAPIRDIPGDPLLDINKKPKVHRERTT